MYKKLILFTALLAFCVVVLGAFVRLSDAGLGCPDWPGCYGQLSPAHAAEEIAQAHAAHPGGPVSHAKAWKEMTHRYFASTLGLLIVVIGIWSWRKRAHLKQAIGLPSFLIALVILQGLFGMWTVTLKLTPWVVTTHLLGGMTTFVLLVWLLQRQRHKLLQLPAQVRALRVHAVLALVAVFIQIALGGWVSSNYAALACTDFPTCHGSWWPTMDAHQAFEIFRPLGMSGQGELLSLNALTAIHWAHRLGAVLILLIVASLALRLMRFSSQRGFGLTLLVLLLLQLSLGILNVLLSLPLPLAVAHNGVAALLLAALTVLNFNLKTAQNRA